jgi:hypothetical protein
MGNARRLIQSWWSASILVVTVPMKACVDGFLQMNFLQSSVFYSTRFICFRILQIALRSWTPWPHNCCLLLYLSLTLVLPLRYSAIKHHAHVMTHLGGGHRSCAGGRQKNCVHSQCCKGSYKWKSSQLAFSLTYFNHKTSWPSTFSDICI